MPPFRWPPAHYEARNRPFFLRAPFSARWCFESTTSVSTVRYSSTVIIYSCALLYRKLLLYEISLVAIRDSWTTTIWKWKFDTTRAAVKACFSKEIFSKLTLWDRKAREKAAWFVKEKSSGSSIAPPPNFIFRLPSKRNFHETSYEKTPLRLFYSSREILQILVLVYFAFPPLSRPPPHFFPLHFTQGWCRFPRRGNPEFFEYFRFVSRIFQ